MQAGRVADTGDIAADGLHLKVIEVYAAKDNAAAGGSRKNPEVDRSPAM